MALRYNGELVTLAHSPLTDNAMAESWEIEGRATAEYRLTELDQVDPAGRWRWQATGDTLVLQHAATAAWATATTILTVNAANTLTLAAPFSSSGLLISNPAGTFNYTVVASAITAARNLTIPLITAGDTLMVLGLAQTMSAAGLALTVTNDVRVGRLGVNFTPIGTRLFSVEGTYTQLSGTFFAVAEINTDLTAIAGAINGLSQVGVDGIIRTAAAADVHTFIGSVALSEPDIRLGAGSSVTTAYTLRIVSAPTEGVNNYALLSDSGANRFDGTVEMQSSAGIGFAGVSTGNGLNVGVASTNNSIWSATQGAATVALFIGNAQIAVLAGSQSFTGATLTFSAATASTSTTTGAVVVTGGVGIAGATFTGGLATIIDGGNVNAYKFMSFNSNAAEAGNVIRVAQTAAVVFTTTSDARAKNIFGDSDITAAHTRVMAYRMRDYEWKSQLGLHFDGPIAQEIYAVNKTPTLVTPGDNWTINMSGFVPDLIMAAQEHDGRLAVLEAENAELRAQFGSLAARLERLERH